MGLEVATYISSLVPTNPVGATDKRSQGDDHIRLIKSALQATFPDASTPFRFPKISAKNANFNVTANDNNTVFLVDTSGGAVTASITAAAATLGSRFRFSIVKTTTDANLITVDPNGTETVDGATTFARAVWQTAIDFFCDGAAFWSSVPPVEGVIEPLASVAAATTTDCYGQRGLRCNVTGSGVNISSLGSGPNRWKMIRFAGANTLVNSAALNLPTGANITTAAGDQMIVWWDSSGNAYVVAYQRANGAALAASGNFTGDSGAGGAAGLVPAPAAGDAAAKKYLHADGTWKAVPVMTGDSGAGGVAGLVPAPSAGDAAASKFLKADGTFAVPPNGYTAPSSGTWPVGAYGLMYLSAGTTPVNNGSTTSGSNLRPAIANSSGVVQGIAGGAQSGTWQNISAATVSNGAFGVFVRIA